MPKRKRVGLSLLIISAVTWSSWTLWSSTRKWCPAEVPLLLHDGARSETGEFSINVTGAYEIDVEAAKTADLPLNILACSMGGSPVWPERKCSVPAVLRVSWSLKSADRTIAVGSSDETHGAGTSPDTVIRTIGYFQGQRGQHYRLATETLSNATALSGSNPRLKVIVGGTIYQSTLIVSGVVRWGSAIIALIGFILLLVPGKEGSLSTAPTA